MVKDCFATDLLLFLLLLSLVPCLGRLLMIDLLIFVTGSVFGKVIND